MLRQSGFGSQGPNSRQPAFGMILAAMAGIPNFIGWPDRGPLPIGVSAYTDCISPRFAAASLIAALDHRRKTGRGQLLDISQFETALSFIMPAILDFKANGREPFHQGNSSPGAAPHGVYPCQGQDSWCAIAVSDDKQWDSLCREMGQPDLADDPRFNTFLLRKEHAEELDRILGEWTANFTSEEVMQRLQAAGVPAGMVKNVAEIYTDPQLRQRNLFWKIQHPEMGDFTHLGEGFSLSKTPARVYSPSPRLGEHTEYILTQLLGMSDEEFADLVGTGVFE
jgi:benzylsuccinate CoA-transferase BbsF subunit